MRLNGHRRGLLLVAPAAALVFTMMAAAPARADLDPTPIPDCDEGSETERECEDSEPGDGNGEAGQGSGGGGCWFEGFEVGCYEPGYGQWVGTPGVLRFAEASPVLSTPAAPPLEGCYAQPSEVPWPDHPRPQDVDADAPGWWAQLSCFGMTPPVMPPPSWAAAVWIAGTPAGPDPVVLARHALASITLSPPQVVVSPPGGGSVPLGMPVWLAVQEGAASWGPATSGPVCDQGLCVTVTARAEQVMWRMGDDNEVVCSRRQNTAWSPGMDFLSPGEACHYFYEAPSRDRPGGRYQASATVVWRADWQGGGQSGAFTEITDVCGVAGDAPCMSTVDIRVEEIQVVGAR